LPVAVAGDGPYLIDADVTTFLQHAASQDLDLPPGYFSGLIDRMEAEPRIGTCSGKAYFPADTASREATRFPLVDSTRFVSEKELPAPADFLSISSVYRPRLAAPLHRARCDRASWAVFRFSSRPCHASSAESCKARP
jgi:hypothetical protein